MDYTNPTSGQKGALQSVVEVYLRLSWMLQGLQLSNNSSVLPSVPRTSENSRQLEIRAKSLSQEGWAFVCTLWSYKVRNQIDLCITKVCALKYT